jgi:hypothetical protein
VITDPDVAYELTSEHTDYYQFMYSVSDCAIITLGMIICEIMHTQSQNWIDHVALNSVINCERAVLNI